MSETPSSAYGTTRERGSNLSHAQIERAALDILCTGSRPSVEIIRKRLGRGSPATIATSLKRFWRDLGSRAEGNPVALARLPGEIADLADGIWQRALALASQTAKHEDNVARERLTRIRIENEVRAQSFALREREFETATRERERALADSRDHLLSTLRMLENDRAILRAREARIADLEAQIENYRAELAAVIAQATARGRKAGRRTPRPLRTAKIQEKSRKRTVLKARRATAQVRRRIKRR
jgi:hypothetical protein